MQPGRFHTILSRNINAPLARVAGQGFISKGFREMGKQVFTVAQGMLIIATFKSPNWLLGLFIQPNLRSVT